MCKVFLSLISVAALFNAASEAKEASAQENNDTRIIHRQTERQRRSAEIPNKKFGICGGNPIPFNPVTYPARSCVDHMMNGATRCGYYVIDDGEESYTVYCDINSEIGAAYTLVESFALKYNDKLFKKKSFTQNFPISHNSPRWDYYRLTKDRMTRLADVSTHWRATCNFPEVGLTYKDYVRVKMRALNPVTFSGGGTCIPVEMIDSHGRREFQLTANFYQKYNYEQLCHSSWMDLCEMKKTPGVKRLANSWGCYAGVDPNFSCAKTPDSTTQFWFGGYVKSVYKKSN
eukprot:m.206322 g.206322  ORF g.206322 m.206322 type:complete len:288 (+) comp39671_c0_seq13:566-1429(+)